MIMGKKDERGGKRSLQKISSLERGNQGNPTPGEPGDAKVGGLPTNGKDRIAIDSTTEELLNRSGVQSLIRRTTKEAKITLLIL